MLSSTAHQQVGQPEAYIGKEYQKDQHNKVADHIGPDPFVDICKRYALPRDPLEGENVQTHRRRDLGDLAELDGDHSEPNGIVPEANDQWEDNRQGERINPQRNDNHPQKKPDHKYTHEDEEAVGFHGENHHGQACGNLGDGQEAGVVQRPDNDQEHHGAGVGRFPQSFLYLLEIPYALLLPAEKKHRDTATK